jgi:hypothetical protein
MSVVKKAVAKWDSRKLQVWGILFLASTAMFYFSEKVSFNDWSSFNQWLAGIYMGGNSLEYFAGAMGSKSANKPDQQKPAEKKPAGNEPPPEI